MNSKSPITRFLINWLRELQQLSKDQGAILFCILLPLGYPLVYSWIYNNEVVHEVPVVVVDNSHSHQSRDFIQKYDASPDVEVAYYAHSISEAQRYIAHEEAYGIIYFPEDYATRIGRHEQAHVSVYCDMSYMLTYKAIFQAATSVASLQGAEIQAGMSGNYTNRENEISAQPLAFDEVPIFNTTAGYGNFVLPGVLVLIIHQALLLCVGLISGTDRERRFISVTNVFTTFLGKTMAYFTIFSIMLAYCTLVVPRLFGFVMMYHMSDWIIFMIPYLFACIFFAICISTMIHYRENVMLVVVFTSLPLLFLSGISWPHSNIPGFLQGVSWIFPSTFGIRGSVRMSSMGATLTDVLPELRALIAQTVVYGLFSLFVIYRRNRIRHAAYGS